MKQIHFFLIIFAIISTYSCMIDLSGQGENYLDSANKTNNTIIKTDTTFMLKAKFISFELNDASHFKFEDKKGKIWDFGGCESKDLIFATDLKNDKQNEQNLGWEGNRDLVEKWFTLKYVSRIEQQNADGPKAIVLVIVSANLITE